MKSFSIVLLFTILAACSSTSDKPAVRELEKWLENHPNNYSHCLIIPGAGCEGCILETEYFVKKYSGRSDILFIFTRVETVKLLKYKLGEETFINGNVLIDTENRFEVIEKDINNIYPVVCRLKNNKVEDLHYVSPKEDAMQQLEDYINKNAAVCIDLQSYLLKGNNESITLSDMIDSLYYIPLDTPEELPVDMVLSVRIMDKSIFVLDKSQNLFRFDTKGKFLNLIGKKGDGPEDYLNVVDFDVNESKRSVHLYDLSKRKILHYNIEGDFEGSTDIPENVMNVSMLDDSTFVGYVPSVLSLSSEEEIFKLDISGKKKEVIYTKSKENSDIDRVDIFRMATFNKTAVGMEFGLPLDNVTYCISLSSTYKMVELELGGFMLPYDIAVNSLDYSKSLNSDYVFELKHQKSQNLHFLSFFYKMEHYRVIYDSYKEKFYTVFKGKYPKGIENNWDDGASFWPLWISGQNKIVGVINSIDEELKNTDGSFSQFQEFTKYDNPILQIVTLKNY